MTNNENITTQRKNRLIVEKSFQEEILLDKDDKDLSISGRKFLNNIEEHYNSFLTRLKREEHSFENVTREMDLKIDRVISFTPEKLTKRSPMTIIDAPWGAGKTYFIESIATNIAIGKIETATIKNVLVIDAWTMSDSKHISDEFVSTLFEKLSISSPDGERKEHFMNIAAHLFDVDARPWTNKFGKDIAERSVSTDQYNSSLSRINLEPTIVFIDNVDRLDSNAWEVIKSIKKISAIPGFIFVLALNVSKLVDNITEEGEFKLEKYVDLNKFIFHQGYEQILKSYGFDDETTLKLVDILESEIEGQKLTIRELELRLDKHNITSEASFSTIVRKFVSNIWGTNIVAADIIREDVDKIMEIYAALDSKTSGTVEEFIEFLNSSKLLSEDETTMDFFDSWIQFRSTERHDEQGEKYYAFKAIKPLNPHPLNNIEYTRYLNSLAESIEEHKAHWESKSLDLQEKFEKIAVTLPNVEDIKNRNEDLLHQYEEELKLLQDADVPNAKEINLMKQSIVEQSVHLKKATEIYDATKLNVDDLDNKRHALSFVHEFDGEIDRIKDLLLKHAEIVIDLKSNFETKQIFTHLQEIIQGYTPEEFQALFKKHEAWDKLKDNIIKLVLGDVELKQEKDKK